MNSDEEKKNIEEDKNDTSTAKDTKPSKKKESLDVEAIKRPKTARGVEPEDDDNRFLL